MAHKIDCRVETALGEMVSDRRDRRDPPAGARCYVCLEGGGFFLPTGCGCRGSAGWMHVDCLFEMIKDRSQGAFSYCPTCRQPYTGELFIRLVGKYWRRHRVKAMKFLQPRDLADDDFRVLDAQDMIAKILDDYSNETALIETLLRRNITLYITMYGPDHKAVYLAVHGLARTLVHEEKYSRAIALLRPYVTEPLDENDWDTGTWKNVIFEAYADLLNDLKRYAEAEILIRGAVAALDRARGDNPESSWITNNQRDYGAEQKRILADALDGQGKHSEAYDLIERVLSDVKRTFGPDHPLTDSLEMRLARSSWLLEGIMG